MGYKGKKTAVNFTGEKEKYNLRIVKFRVLGLISPPCPYYWGIILSVKNKFYLDIVVISKEE